MSWEDNVESHFIKTGELPKELPIEVLWPDGTITYTPVHRYSEGYKTVLTCPSEVMLGKAVARLYSPFHQAVYEVIITLEVFAGAMIEVKFPVYDGKYY